MVSCSFGLGSTRARPSLETSTADQLARSRSTHGTLFSLSSMLRSDPDEGMLPIFTVILYFQR